MPTSGWKLTSRFGDVRFGPLVGQIGPKWKNSETFSEQISMHFGVEKQNVKKTDLKKFGFISFRVNLPTYSEVY